MAVIQAGASANLLEVDPNHLAGRVSVRPPKVTGAYRVAAFTGLLSAIPANGVIFSFRWGSATHLALIQSIRLSYATITGFTAAQEISHDIIIARAFTASDTGGTAIVMTGNNNKKRTSHVTSQIATNGDIRISTVNALGAGTKTLDANPLIAIANKTYAATANNDAQFVEEFESVSIGSHFYVLAQNEGFNIRNSILMGAAGTIRATVDVAWMETLNADYTG